MRKGHVFVNRKFAGVLTERNNGEYSFEYDSRYLTNSSLPAISLTLPKRSETYTCPHLFPFFANMLSEGSNRAVQAKMHHIDIDDDFGILLATAYLDTPGAVTVTNVTESDE